MADLSKKYQEILDELEAKIQNPHDLEFVKSKISDLTMLFMDSIDKLLSIESHQTRQDKKIGKIERDISHIQEDIYINDGDDEDEFDGDDGCECDEIHDNDYEFEIVCPYCDYEFVADNSFKNQKDIECPQCHKLIELDWNDIECTGNCDSCASHCYEDNKTIKIPSVAEDNTEYNSNSKQNYNMDNNENTTKNKNGNKNNQQSNNENKKKENQDNNKNEKNNENEDDM